MRKFKNTNALHQSQKHSTWKKKRKKVEVYECGRIVSQQMMNEIGFQHGSVCVCVCVRWLRFWSCGRVQRQFSVEESNLAASYQRMMLARLSGTLDCCSCQQRCTPRSHRASICSLCWATQWGGSIVEVVLERRETCLSHWDGYSFMMGISKHCVLW